MKTINEFVAKWQHIFTPEAREDVTQDLENLTHSLAWWQPCGGCKEGHPSFWKTVVESPQWKAWEKEIDRRLHAGNETDDFTGCWDIMECEECNIISPEHFQDFLKWVKEQPK